MNFQYLKKIIRIDINQNTTVMKKGKFSITKRSFICSVVFLFLFGSHLSFASLALQEVDQQDQSYTEYKGEVLDSKSSEPLVFADLNVSDTNISTITNTEGEFLLKVPNDLLDKSVTISFLGYNKYVLPLSEFNKGRTKIKLDVFVTQLTQVSLKVPKDAISLVRATLKRKGGNYYNNQAIMTAFYRETIKKRRKNASLSEAVLEIYKQPYASKKRDHITLVKARKALTIRN